VWCFFVAEGARAVPETDDSDDAAVDAPTRRRAPGADPEVRSFGKARVCAADGCETTLSRYNPDDYCSLHRGWDKRIITRRRRAEDEGE
jgi:hypothetical protein